MKNRNSKYIVKKLSWITLGAFIQGFAMGQFLFLHDIPSGGAGGLTVLLHHFTNLPLGTALWIINASMLLVAVHYFGNANAVGTLYGITITSLSVNFFQSLPSFLFQNHLLDLVIGSITLGTGVSILIHHRISNGGIGVIALVLYKLKRIDPGRTLFWINGFIFVFTAYIIDWKIVFEALFCQWISTRIVDRRLPHFSIPKRFHLTPAGRKK